MNLRIKKDAVEPVTAFLLDAAGAGVTALSPTLTIRQSSTDQFWTGTALQSAPTNLAMTEVDATDAPGEYRFNFDTGAGSGAPEGEYILRVDVIAGVTNLPQSGIVKVGEYISDILNHSIGNRRINPIAGGWQEVVFDELAPATIVATYDLFDQNGSAITSSNNPLVSSGVMIGRRIRV